MFKVTLNRDIHEYYSDMSIIQHSDNWGLKSAVKTDGLAGGPARFLLLRVRGSIFHLLKKAQGQIPYWNVQLT